MSLKLSSLWTQLLVTFLGNMSSLSFGIHIGWLAPLDKQLQSINSPFGRPLTPDETFWLGAIPIAAMLVGMPLFGYLLQKTPGKLTVLVATFPHTVVFAVLVLSRHINIALAMRFLGGIASAGALIACPVYINECVDEKRRGLLCGASAFFINIGVVISYTVGSYAPYAIFNLVCLCFPALFISTYWWLPESPVRLLDKGDIEGAKKSIRLLRNCSEDDVELETYRLMCEREAVLGEKIRFCEAFGEKTTRSAVFIAMVIMTTQQLIGITPTNINMIQIVSKTSSVDPNISSIVISIVQLLASVCGPLLLNWIGRKTLLICCGWISTVALSVVASSYFLCDSIIPAVGLAVFIAGYSMGLGTVPFVLLPELLPVKIRGAAVAFVGIWVGILTLVVTKLYYVAIEIITVSECFFIYSVFSFLGTVLIHIFVFETQGLNAADIYKRLKGKSS